MIFSIKSPDDILAIRKLHAGLSDISEAPADLCEALIKLCACEDRIIVRLAMNTLMSAVQMPIPPTPKSRNSWTFVPVPQDDSYSNTKPTRFRIGAWQIEPDDWCDVVQYACEILYLEHTETFVEQALKVTGPHRDYFSFEDTGLRQSKEISSSGLFVTTNLKAGNSVSFVNELADLFGYEKPEIDYF